MLDLLHRFVQQQKSTACLPPLTMDGHADSKYWGICFFKLATDAYMMQDYAHGD
jgi:hypothetical protein